MKKITYSLLAIVAIVSLVSCSNDTYSSRLKSEKELITDFIHRQGIQVVNEIPEVWGEKDYYLVPEYDYMYYHLDQLGDTTKEEIKKVKKLAQEMLGKIKARIHELDHWRDKEETQSIISVLIRDLLWSNLPESYSDNEIAIYKQTLYEYVYNTYPAA